MCWPLPTGLVSGRPGSGRLSSHRPGKGGISGPPWHVSHGCFRPCRRAGDGPGFLQTGCAARRCRRSLGRQRRFTPGEFTSFLNSYLKDFLLVSPALSKGGAESGTSAACPEEWAAFLSESGVNPELTGQERMVPERGRRNNLKINANQNKSILHFRNQGRNAGY